MSPDPNTPDDGGSGSGWFPLLLAIVISAIALFLIVPNSRRHASDMDILNLPLPRKLRQRLPLQHHRRQRHRFAETSMRLFSCTAVGLR